jgi:hypothetical protein
MYIDFVFERIPRPFIRPKTEEEGKESRFDKPFDVVSGRFFDDFIEENKDWINRKEFGLLGLKLSAGIAELVSVANKDKGNEFAIALEKHLLDDVFRYRSIVPDRSNDVLMKKKAAMEMAEDLRVRGVAEEEIPRLESEEEFGEAA